MNVKAVRQCIDQSAKVPMGRNGKHRQNILFNMEKRNYNKRVISELKTENEEHIIDESQILSELETYFYNLYSSKMMANLSDFDQFTQNIEIPHLTEYLRIKLRVL